MKMTMTLSLIVLTACAGSVFAQHRKTIDIELLDARYGKPVFQSPLVAEHHPRVVKRASVKPAACPIITLEAVVKPGHVLRHAHYAGKLERIKPHDEKFFQNSQFIMHPGLAGDGVSFESVNFPGYFLKHESYVIKLRKFKDSHRFAEDATFIPQPGLCGEGTSFESFNYPGHFLRHKDYWFYIDDCDRSDRFAGDSTFNVLHHSGSVDLNYGGDTDPYNLRPDSLREPPHPPEPLGPPLGRRF